MRKVLIALAAVSFGATAAHAADMDCCKDGSCACCQRKTDAPKPQQPKG